MIKQWVDYKRNQEYYPVRNRPHPYEMYLYYDV
jgi:glutamine synthetase